MIFNQRIFLDYASTTPVDRKVFQKMKRYFSDSFANAQSIHSEGNANKKVLKSARRDIADLIQVKPEEIIFTPGGTASNNLAIVGLAKQAKKYFEQKDISVKPHFITTNIEHVAVLNSFEYLKKNGCEITYLEVNKEGLITAEQALKALKPNTVLVSVMLANNEIGTILPIRDISRAILKYKKEKDLTKNNYPYFHTDASQAPNYLDINVDRLGVDLMSLDGSKIYGPKGIGCLIKKNYIQIDSLSYGGGQEFGLQAGTENLPLIVGFAEALKQTLKIQKTESERLMKIRDYFISELQNKFSKIKMNGSLKKRLPNNINFCYPNLNAEFTVIQLDEAGIACSATTACRSMNEISSSYVVEAVNSGCGQSSLRFSLGRDTKIRHIKKTLKALSKILK